LKKKGKILISLLVMLVITSNISYSVTLSICRMSMKSSCSCDMSKDNDIRETVKKAPCCKEEVKDISNTSDYETSNTVKILLASGVINLSPEQINPNFSTTSETPLRFIFYNKSTDLPVRYSSLLI
jgi:hypothetical protein